MAKHKKSLSDKLATSKKKNNQPGSSKFETKFSRNKHNVVGKTGRCGQPLASKTAALERRAKTIGVASSRFGKSSSFVDRRLAERNVALSKEEKMARRFAAERQRRYAKHGAFNLEEGNEANLTHYGQTLAEIERFDSAAPASDEDDEENLPADVNFGGDVDDASRGKTRKELINEMISKSKQAKHEKQAQRLEAQNLIEELDDQWKNALKNDWFHTLSKNQHEPIAAKPETQTTNKSVDYDTLVRELVFDRKTGPAQDKLKSQEELAEEQLAKTAELEEEKRQRMNAPGDALVGHRPPTHFNPDDLDTNCFIERRRLDPNAKPLAYGANGKNLVDDNNEKEEEEEVETEDLTEFEIALQKTSLKSAKLALSTGTNIHDASKMGIQASKLNDLDLTADNVPTSYAELVALLAGRPVDEQRSVFDTLLEILQPRLKPGNKQMLQKLFLFTLRYFDETCSKPSLDFKLLDTLTIYLFKLKAFGTGFAAKAMKALLKRHRQTFLSANASKVRKSPPKANIVFFLRLVAHLFPVTDFYHPLVTPCFLFLAEIFGRIRVKTSQHAAQSLLLCAIFVDYVKEAKKFAPELLEFLQNFLARLLCAEKSNKIKLLPSNFDDGAESEKISISKAYSKSGDFSTPTLLCCAVKLCRRLCAIYKELPSWPEIFAPISTLFSISDSCYLNNSYLKQEIESFQNDFAKISSNFSKRPFLTYSTPTLADKPTTITFLEPKVEKHFDPDKKKFQFSKGPKAQTAKLKRRYKREYKGAVRELRRDNEFLAARQFKEASSQDEQRKANTKRLMASLMGQEADYKKMKRAKD